jgi:hypothetical protein
MGLDCTLDFRFIREMTSVPPLSFVVEAVISKTPLIRSSRTVHTDLHSSIGMTVTDTSTHTVYRAPITSEAFITCTNLAVFTFPAELTLLSAIIS